MTDTQAHWERTYTSKAETTVSWFQPVLTKSLQLIRDAATNTQASVIDIGGGASTLPDSLLSAGFGDVSVLDISPAALARSQDRLGLAAARINWLIADITTWMPSRTWDVWHDRAVFHFLTDKNAQDRYITALRHGTRTGSTVIISTFAPDGPERCSGLTVRRYSATALAERVGAPFLMVDHHTERHVTPGSMTQSFVYAVLKRK